MISACIDASDSQSDKSLYSYLHDYLLQLQEAQFLQTHSAPATCFLMLDWSDDFWLELLAILLAAGDKEKEDALCPGIRTSDDMAFSPRHQLWWLTKAFPREKWPSELPEKQEEKGQHLGLTHKILQVRRKCGAHACTKQQQLTQQVLISNRRKVDKASSQLCALPCMEHPWYRSSCRREKKKLAAPGHSHSPWQQEHQSVS